MTIPADQALLYQDLSSKLDGVADEEDLARYMGQVLRTLLRRKGDAEFLSLVQDALTEGLASRTLDEQRDLSREVIQVVIEKRPEIAAAWQALHGVTEPAPAQRRAVDRAPSPPPPPAKPARPQPAPEPRYRHAAAERVLAAFVGDVLERRLGIFKVGGARFPSMAYCHEQPFFLFDPRFAPVVRRYVTEVVLVFCRDALERHLYRHIKPETGKDEAALNAWLTEKRPEAWKVLTETLTKLAGHHRTAEAKLTAAEREDGGGPEFAEVEVAVNRPRVFKVLGVSFTLGQEKAKRKMKVRLRATTELDRDEMVSMDMIARLTEMAGDEGLDLPPACDFNFLRTLLDFDAKKYAGLLKEIVALARHKETTRQYLFERLRYADETYSNTLSDALVLFLFHEIGGAQFGFREIYDICIGTALAKSARASRRPFLQFEVDRRPRELAFQIREVLRRRYDEETLATTIRLLLEVWQTMARTRFQHELDAALTVLGAFPIAFAGDPEEATFTQIGHQLHAALTASELEVEATVAAAVQLYRPLTARLRAG
ncbi:MAG: hypothetical protein ACM33T_08530 [Solirubrobacterales bacterium]